MLPELVAHIAGYCYGKEKNRLMRLNILYCNVIKDKTLLFTTNINTISQVDKIEALIHYGRINNITMVKFLIDHGVDVNSENILGMTLYHVAPNLTRLFPNMLNKIPFITPLHRAVYKGDMQEVKRLLNGCPIRKLPNEYTPIVIAACKGHIDIVKLLISKDIMGFDLALRKASSYGYVDIVKLLVESYQGTGVNINCKYKEGLSPLHFASRSGHTDIVTLLLTLGAQVDLINRDKETPLHLACEYGYIDIVKLLLDYGANIDQPNECGWTPLHYATEHNHINIVEWLIDKGAMKDLENSDGWLPSHFAYTRNINMVKLLINPLHINYPTNEGATPLILAIEDKNMDIVKFLIKQGANINYKKDNGSTCLMISLQFGTTEISKLLILKGADVNYINHLGHNALVKALRYNSDCVRLLINYGADVNDGPDGWTPLSIASYYCDVTIVKLLLDYGAISSPLTTDSTTDLMIKKGDTPLSIAQKKNKYDIVKLLQNYC